MAAMGEAEQGVALRELKQACEAMRGALEDLYALKKAPGQERHGSNHHGERGHSHHHHNNNHDGPVDKAAALKAQRWKVLKLLSSMKAGLRDSFLAADDWKARVQEQKNRVEAHQLKLQNLLYEKDHLLREIRRCRGFSTKEMDKIEFEGGSIPIAVDADVHRQHLDQLTREHATRKQLQTELKELKEKIEQVDAASQTKQTFLDGLRSQVDGIEDATKGLQGYMGKPVTAQLRRQHAAGQLPTPLYALYCELEAYQSASDTSRQLTLEVVTAPGLKHSGAGHLKRGFPTALVNASASANTSERGRSSSKRPKRQPSRSPSVTNGTPGATPTPSRSPSEGHSKDTQEEPENGEIVATHTADKLLALRPHDDKSKEDDRMEVDDDSSRTAPSIDPSAKLERRHIESEAKEGDEDALVDASTVIVNLWEPSEKALLLTVSVASGASTTDKLHGSSAATINGSFTVMFQYFPTTKIVTAEIVNSVPIGFAHGHHNVLMNLFPGDDGLETPRAANNYTFAGASDGNGVPVEFEFPASATCRPYHWAQWVCGLYPLKRVEEGGALQEASHPRRPEPSIRSVMGQLVKRFVVAVHLKKHLEQLAKAARMSETVISMDPAARHLFPDVPTTQLVDWKEVSAPHFDLFQLFKNQQRSQRQRQLGTPSFQLPTTGCRYFRAEFRNGTTRLPAMVEISPEYPVRAPRFLFQPRATSGSTKTVENGQLPLYENQLKEIEIEVNAFYNELIPHGCERFLLMHQLRKVLQCVDVLSRGSAGQPALCFGRERRGKDRRQAIVMDTASKELSHR